MKRSAVWIILGVAGLGALVALPALFMFGAWGTGYGGRMMGGYGGGMMGGGMMSGGMMANWFGPWARIWMILGWVILLAVLAFLVTATIWLLRSLASPRGPSQHPDG